MKTGKTEAKRKGSLFVTSARENLILSFNWTSTRLLKMLEKFCLETMFCSFVHSEMFFIRRSTRAVKTFSLGFKSKLCNFYMSFLIYQKTYVFHSTVDSQFLKFIRLTTASAFFASFWHFVTSKKQMICNSIITYNQKYVLSRPQHKESKLLASLVYFSKPVETSLWAL